jgi:hypothetical protein
MANAYAHYKGEILAFVFTKDGKVLFPYKHIKFPFITVRSGQSVPDGSLLKRGGARRGLASDLCACIPDIWIDVERGKPAPQLYEQVLGQRDDFAIIMLWLETMMTGMRISPQRKDFVDSGNVFVRGK